MRTRVRLTGVALAAALMTGGTIATANATPASSETSAPTFDEAAFGRVHVGDFPSLNACVAAGNDSVYSRWDCRKAGKVWQLWADLNS
ncbi:hypothetical protein ACFZBU_06885 [Embleya sp. NPDC008237]|uniref:hypothetical protein n=1 Tax=Embleya sp. NPDC008237 TaxID=3363978 RepID=UPI0036E470B7